MSEEMVSDILAAIEAKGKLRAERDRWRTAAKRLARALSLKCCPNDFPFDDCVNFICDGNVPSETRFACWLKYVMRPEAQ